ncbi:MAG TPA: hypothetical protein VHI52_17305, partial [Verrucomicrobiae bacterium]|nr:hypothetical protein [Verrucomicrobiae bacterium]
MKTLPTPHRVQNTPNPLTPKAFHWRKPEKLRPLAPLAALHLGLLFSPAMAQQSPLDHWTARSASNSGHLLDLAYGHGTFIAVGGLPPFNPTDPIQPNLLASADGLSWTPLTLPTNANFFGVAYVNDQFVAVGDSGLIITSADGASWELRNSGAPNRTADIYPLGGVAYGEGIYVAMDRLLGNYCLVSTNAIDWHSIQLQPGSGYVEMDRVR